MLSTAATPFDIPASSMQAFHFDFATIASLAGVSGAALWGPWDLNLQQCSWPLPRAFPSLLDGHGNPFCFSALHPGCPSTALLKDILVLRASQTRVLSMFLWSCKHTVVDLSLAFHSSFRQSGDCLTNETGIFIITCQC